MNKLSFDLLKSESPPATPIIPITPSIPADEIPAIPVTPLTEKRTLRRELEPFLGPDGRITNTIPVELPPLSEDQRQCVADLISDLKGSLRFLNRKSKGQFVTQWVGGGVRDIFYKDPSYLHSILRLFEIPHPERYDALFEKYARREVPDTDLRIWLKEQDGEDMGGWPHYLSSYRKVSWEHHHCSTDANYAIAHCPNKKRPKDEFLFVRRFKRQRIFKHELMIELNDPSKFAIPKSPEESSEQELDSEEKLQAVFDLMTRRLHVDRPEEVNYEGLPILISYYVQGWTLGDAEVEPIFFKKFLERAASEGGIAKSFRTHFQKTWKKHHFSDPNAAIALAFNFCAGAKGMEGVSDEDLISILRDVYTWVPGDDPFKEFVFRDECTIDSLFEWVYTQGILGGKSGALLDHRDGEAFQLEFPGKRELFHLLIPKQYCHISFKGSEKAFSQMVPNPIQTEELGVAVGQLWEQADALWSEEKKSRRQVNQGCGAMILSQLLQPSPEKELSLLRRLPLMMAVQSDEGNRFHLLECLRNAIGKNYRNLLQQSEQHLKEPFDGAIFLFEWIKILASQRVEGSLRDISWDLWISKAPKNGKARVKKEQQLFESYFPYDIEKSLKLFSSFCPSLTASERLKYWRRLCESPGLLRARVEDLEGAVDSIGKIPLDLAVDKRFYTENVALFRSLIEREEAHRVYPLMKQALSNGLLHSCCPDLKEVWFDLCSKLLPLSVGNANEALEIGTKKSLFMVPTPQLLHFKLTLAQSLHDSGSFECANGLIASIRKHPKLSREVKAQLLAIEENEVQKQFEGMESKSPDAAALSFDSWLQRANTGVADLKSTSSLLSYFKTRDSEIVSTIVCHSATSKLFKSNFNFFSGPLIELVQQCKTLKKPMMVLKVFFDFIEAFERDQKKVGLLAAYEYLSNKHLSAMDLPERGGLLIKLPNSIKHNMVKYATLLMASYPPLSCFYFLKGIDCQFRPDPEAWDLLVTDVTVEEQLFKIILEFKSVGAPLTCLDSLVQRLFEHPGPETIKQIREFLSWEIPPLEGDYSTPLIASLKTLDPDIKARVARLDKDLLERLIPRDDLKQLIYDLIHDVYKEDVEETLILAGKYGFFNVHLLHSLLEKVVASDQRHLKLKVRDFCCRALQEDDFELDGDQKLEIHCWNIYLSLCAEFGDRGMARFLHQSVDGNSPFSKVLTDLDPEFKAEILGSLAIAALKGVANEQAIEALVPIIDQVICSSAPSQEWIEALVSGYLISSSPQIFLAALRHLVKLECINDPGIFPAVFTRFASIAAQEFPEREEVSQLILKTYEIAEDDSRFFKQIPFASVIFEGVSKFHNRLLINLADRLLLQVSKQSDWDVTLQHSIRDFLLSLLKSEDPGRQRLAQGLIKVNRFDKLLDRELTAELRFHMVQIKIDQELEARTGLSTLNRLLHECLDSFEYVFQTSYQLRMSQNFMTLLAKYNAASPISDGKAFNDYLEAYAGCLYFSYEDPSQEIKEDPQNVLELFNHCARVELLMYPNLREKVLLPSQVFVLETAKLSFVSYENRTETVDFIVLWIHSFILASIEFGCERRPIVEAHMIYALIFWIKGLSITQICDHMARVDPVLELGLKTSILFHRDLIFKLDFMLSPIEYLLQDAKILHTLQLSRESCLVMSASPQSKDPATDPECNLNVPMDVQMESAAKRLPKLSRKDWIKLFSDFIIGLIKTLEPSAFCWAMIALHHHQNDVFKGCPEEYNSLLNEVYEHYETCYLQHPYWYEKVSLYDKQGSPVLQEASLITLIGLAVKNRLDLLNVAWDNGEKYSYPLISKFLSIQIRLSEAVSRDFVLETSCVHSLNTGALLARYDIWTAFVKNIHEYWQLVELWVDHAMKLLKDPGIAPVHGTNMCLRILGLQADLGGFGNSPFSGIELDKRTRQIQIRIRLKSVPTILAYYKSIPEPDQQFRIFLKLFKQLAPTSIMLDGMTPSQRKEFLAAFQS